MLEQVSAVTVQAKRAEGNHDPRAEALAARRSSSSAQLRRLKGIAATTIRAIPNGVDPLVVLVPRRVAGIEVGGARCR
jgi:hypothetical protein